MFVSPARSAALVLVSATLVAGAAGCRSRGDVASVPGSPQAIHAKARKDLRNNNFDNAVLKLEALEARYPMLRGTIRDHVTLKRRPFLRFFACKQDVSIEPPDTPLPEAIASGEEPFFIVGAIAGG